MGAQERSYMRKVQDKIVANGSLVMYSEVVAKSGRRTGSPVPWQNIICRQKKDAIFLTVSNIPFFQVTIPNLIYRTSL